MANLSGTYTWRTSAGLDDGIADTIHGTSGDDTINGYGGADHLYGNGGHDVINGGRGDDWIRGGTGWDTLTGGSGRDTFEFYKGDSGPTFAGADVITDFNTNDDHILFQTTSPAGSNSNYSEFLWTGDLHNTQSDFNEMKALAQEDMHGKVQFVFGTNGTNGYLFADLDHNGTIDTAIELPGLRSTGDFSHLNIL